MVISYELVLFSNELLAYTAATFVYRISPLWTHVKAYICHVLNVVLAVFGRPWMNTVGLQAGPSIHNARKISHDLQGTHSLTTLLSKQSSVSFRTRKEVQPRGPFVISTRRQTCEGGFCNFVYSSLLKLRRHVPSRNMQLAWESNLIPGYGSLRLT
jgi:hypothetical protein